MRTVDVAGFKKMNITEGEFANKFEFTVDKLIDSDFTYMVDRFQENLEIRIQIPLETFSDFEVCERCSDVVPVKELKSVQISADSKTGKVCDGCRWELTEDYYVCDMCYVPTHIDDFTDADYCQSCTDYINKD